MNKDTDAAFPDLNDAEAVKEGMARAPVSNGIFRRWRKIFNDPYQGINKLMMKAPRSFILQEEDALTLLYSADQSISANRARYLDGIIVYRRV